MPELPARPDLDLLRRRARDLLRAARAGDAAAAAALGSVSDQPTLAAAQLAVARDYGFAGWPALAREVRARTASLEQRAVQFCEASIRGGATAPRMLAETPDIAEYGFAGALVLGDVDAVRHKLERDPGAASRPPGDRGWRPLHIVCSSRWHRWDPARAAGMAQVVRALIEAGADPAEVAPTGHWVPLTCAVAGAANPGLVAVLLGHGAVPQDRDLYLAGFADDGHACLRMLIERTADMAATALMALAAPISQGDAEGVGLLLQAGADPRRYQDDQDSEPSPVLHAAIRCDVPAELFRLLLEYGADPSAPGPDGRSPYRAATVSGRSDLAQSLLDYGAQADTTPAELLVAACVHADAEAARAIVAEHASLPESLAESDQGAALVHAADAGDSAAVRLMLDLGFDPNAHGGDNGACALHAAAGSGSVDTVRLILSRGADIEARDTTWDSTPLDWAVVGSGFRLGTNPAPDWPATVTALLDAGAETREIVLSPDSQKPPSAEVDELLRARGIGTGTGVAKG